MAPNRANDGHDQLLEDVLGGDGPSPQLLVRYAEDPAALSPEERSAVESAAAHSRVIADQLRVLQSFDPSGLGDVAAATPDATPAQTPRDAESAGWLAPLRRFAEALTAPPVVWAPAAAALVLLLALVSWRTLEDSARVGALETELAATLRSLEVLKQDLTRVSEDSSRQTQQLALLRSQLSQSQAELASRPEAVPPGAEEVLPEAEAVPPAIEKPAPTPPEKLAATPGPAPAPRTAPPRKPTAPPEKATTPPPVIVAMNDPLVYQTPAGIDAGQAPSRTSALMRSAATGLPEVVAVAPDHVGLTVSASPALHWRLSSRTDRPLVVTVVDPKRQQTLLDTRLRGPQRRGYARISLSKHGVSLQPGRTYQWFVSVLAGEASAPNDPVASGLIERVSKSPQLAASLRAAGPAGAAQAYAKHGIWYDAIDALSQRIVRFPKNLALRAQRESLVKQVGLPEASRD
jgi:uncharacterized coiled-coil protein SlyX